MEPHSAIPEWTPDLSVDAHFEIALAVALYVSYGGQYGPSGETGSLAEVLAKYGRRLAVPDVLAALDALDDLALAVKAEIDNAAMAARDAGLSWAEIAYPLRMTRQAAYDRWGARVREHREAERRERHERAPE